MDRRRSHLIYDISVLMDEWASELQYIYNSWNSVSISGRPLVVLTISRNMLDVRLMFTCFKKKPICRMSTHKLARPKLDDKDQQLLERWRKSKMVIWVELVLSSRISRSSSAPLQSASLNSETLTFLICWPMRFPFCREVCRNKKVNICENMHSTRLFRNRQNHVETLRLNQRALLQTIFNDSAGVITTSFNRHGK